MPTAKTITAAEALLKTSGPAVLLAADPADQQAGKAGDGFAMTLYTGSTFEGHWYWGDVILDVSGFQPTRQDLPALLRHDPSQVCGFTTELAADAAAATITAKGRFLKGDAEAEPFANLVRARLAQSFPYQCSGAWKPLKVEEIEANATTTVNGKTVNGPITIFRAFTISEASFAEMGWDPHTEAVAAGKPAGEAVTFELLSASTLKGTETMKNIALLASLREIVGADKAIELLSAKADAADLSAFAPEIAAELKSVRASLATVTAERDQLKTDLAAANAAPVVSVIAADPSKPQNQKPAAGTVEAHKAEYAASAELQAEFPTEAEFLFFKRNEAAQKAKE